MTCPTTRREPEDTGARSEGERGAGTRRGRGVGFGMGVVGNYRKEGRSGMGRYKLQRGLSSMHLVTKKG